MHRRTISGLFLVLLTIGVFTPVFNIQPVKTDRAINQSITLGTITIQGKATLEGAGDHSGISIEVSLVKLQDHSSNKVAETTTGSDGLYQITGVPSLSGDDRYGVRAFKDGYASDSIYPPIYSSEATPGAVVVVHDMVLHTQKWVSFDWTYQPDGTTNLSTGDLSSGSVVLYSSVEGLGGDDACGFIFSTNSVTYPVADVYFLDSRIHPYSFWANNGHGGVHDMGAVPLDSVSEAPDVSNGVGIYEFYDNQATDVIVGHTYCIVTKNGSHHAKICVTGVSEQPEPLPTISLFPHEIYLDEQTRNFTVNVNIENLRASHRLVGVDFRLECDLALVSSVEMIDGFFWKDFGDIFSVILSEMDSILISIVLLPDSNGVYTRFPEGNGTMAVFSFVIAGPANSTIYLISHAADVEANMFIQNASDHCHIRVTWNRTDLNADGKVDILDLSVFAKAFASRLGHYRWNWNVDIDGNQMINIIDAAKIIQDFGKHQ